MAQNETFLFGKNISLTILFIVTIHFIVYLRDSNENIRIAKILAQTQILPKRISQTKSQHSVWKWPTFSRRLKVYKFFHGSLDKKTRSYN